MITLSISQLAGIIAFIILIVILSVWIKQLLYAWKIRRHFRKGKRAEKGAKKVLKKNGFKIHEEQVALSHIFRVDQEQVKIDLNADFLVSKDGLKYLVEVKSGESAPSVRNKETRRQLLEYHHINPCDGLLLVDMANKQVRRVYFDS